MMEKQEGTPTDMIEINRKIYSQEEFDRVCHYDKPAKAAFNLGSTAKAVCTCSRECWKQKLLNGLPVINIMANYKWKEWLMSDVIAGISVGIIHIPQGMGFSILASLPPSTGCTAPSSRCCSTSCSVRRVTSRSERWPSSVCSSRTLSIARRCGSLRRTASTPTGCSPRTRRKDLEWTCQTLKRTRSAWRAPSPSSPASSRSSWARSTWASSRRSCRCRSSEAS